MGTLVVDSSVLIAGSNQRDPLNRRARALARQWQQADTRLLLPAVVYSEVMAEPIRAGSDAAMDSELRKTGFEIVPVDEAIAREAARARAQRPGLRLPDALVIATAAVNRAELATLDRGMLAAFETLKG